MFNFNAFNVLYSIITSCNDNFLLRKFKFRQLEPVFLIIIFISSIYYITFTFLFLNNYKAKLKYIIIISLIFSVLSIILINGLKIFYESFSKQNHNSNKEQFYQSNIISDGQAQMASTIHDVKNSMFAILCYMYNKDYDKAQNKIGEICDCISHNSQSNLIHNKCLDKLLCSKTQLISNEHIELIVESNLCDDLKLDIFDICIILGNSLDNAIEACRRINNLQKRFIKLIINYDDGDFLLSISNPINKYVNLDFKTTKDNKALHGFGIKNIKKIVRKYNGNLSVSQFNNIFSLDISFNTNSCKINS